MSILATNDITNDMETGRGDGAATVESSGLFADTAKKDKQYIKPSVFAIAALLLIIGLVSYTWSSNNTNILPMAASSSKASMQQKQNRHLIDLSSWFTSLSTPSPTQSPTRKPTIDMSDWAEALKDTPPPSQFPTHSPSKQPTLPPSPPPTIERPDRDGYTTLITESFTRGYGLFSNHSSNSNSKHYLSTWGLNMGEAKSGVVRIIHDGSSNEKMAEITSNEIPLADKDVSSIKISFTFLSIGMESNDSLCLDYAFDGGAITGKRCWTKAVFEKNGIWIEMSHEFATTVNAQSLVVRLRVEGNDSLDDVLVDSVVVKGKASI